MVFFTAETWNLRAIFMILNFKCTDFFTLCQKDRCVSLLIIHCDVAWYIVELWPRHSFDLCNNFGILVCMCTNCIFHVLYYITEILSMRRKNPINNSVTLNFLMFYIYVHVYFQWLHLLQEKKIPPRFIYFWIPSNLKR